MWKSKIGRVGGVNLNLVVLKVVKLRIEWFHSTYFQKSRGSMAPLEPPLTRALIGIELYLM